MLNNIKNKISLLNSELGYKLALVKYRKNLSTLAATDYLIAETLKRQGVYITSLEDLGLPSTTQMLVSANSYATSMATPRDIHAGYKLPQIYTVTDLPEFFSWGIEERLQKIIENYIGLPIAFHGVHVRKDFPNEQQVQTLLWHKDSEDRRMIKIIIYLDDVTEKHGPFEYVPKPASFLEKLNYYRVDYMLWRSNYLGIDDKKLMEIIPKSAWKSCPGKAGTVIFVDPRNVLHHGTVRTKERSTLFFVYTANPPKRPELCREYHDDTFARPQLSQQITRH
ncbi:phytanoyl-CoA dioxygenase family protein [Anabaena cylindrica FACHB-243]|nr:MULTISPECIES: phytanoyl-CoA dioxygenase family protein [Anabaena]MBD2421315.1 phytanoyl-CoA dioxygenase family protein [Anabaena cylindrica FACHB-243]MCM2406647.1 phytanoyl-CoA dioxygenase family protein [Anabaena sp. CCAP 1446/1C]